MVETEDHGGAVSRADPLLGVVANLARYHREDEEYYSEAPLADAISVQRSARTLIALAERWTTATPEERPSRVRSPGLSTSTTIGRSRPAASCSWRAQGSRSRSRESSPSSRPRRRSGEQMGSWLAAAMEASWSVAEALLAYPQLAEALEGQR